MEIKWTIKGTPESLIYKLTPTKEKKTPLGSRRATTETPELHKNRTTTQIWFKTWLPRTVQQEERGRGRVVSGYKC